MNTILYMAYGSNLNLRQMAKRCPTAKVFGTALLRDYRMVFRRVATIEPCKGSVVPVAIWTIDRDCERSLDSYEGYPLLYRKEYIPISVYGVQCEAMVYVMNGGTAALPDERYYRTIEEGYYDVGFDVTHLHNALKATMEST